MSGIPPHLDTSPGTPSQEWARSTTTAAFARTEPAPALAPGAIPPDANTAQPPSSLAPGSVPPRTGGVSISSANNAQKGAFDPELAHGVPGAYPVTPGDHDPTRQTSLQETAQTAAGQASNFVSSAAQTAAQYLPQGVVDTVSSIMPTSSATKTMNTARASEHDAEHTTSFPSSEVTGAGTAEHVGGVGSLPGFVNESSVPKLPQERTDDERYMTAAGAAAVVAGGAYALKDKIVGSTPSQDEAKQALHETAQKVQNTTQGATQTVQSTAQSAAHTAKHAVPGAHSHSTAITASTLPAHEPFGAQPGDHSSGVGALPGNQSEASVALLPEESAHPQYDSGPIGTSGQVALKPSEEATGNESSLGQARNVAGVGALVGGRNEEGVARLPEERSTTGSGISSTVKPTQEEKGNEAATGQDRHVGGVGALVGDKNEEGVARLPDERSQGSSGFTPVGAVVGSRDEQGKQTVTPSTTDKPSAPAKDSSTHETAKKEMGASGTKGLPNKVSQAFRGVCMLERTGETARQHQLPGDPGTGRFAVETKGGKAGREEQASSTQADQLHATLRPRPHALGGERAWWGGVPLNGERARAELNADADDRDRADESAGYDTDYHPAEMHPPEQKYQNPSEHAAEGEKSLGATQADQTRPPEEQHPPHSGDAHGQKEKKASFMEKMKGEAKVLLGKIEGKHEKVQQGQKLKSGEAKATSA
ncbi:hypothetical protein L226DRAFT_511379 [Lentinus tigrinus ALCF2SS1-7]|uniref:uncharacterized protein n=1 Tax=Lentinus tigrinus ALCF2SS1-7 TaxID=1328758 RepID=UPI001165DCEA|nr:hypothetical protein L226DRAFT_511379 [Lentinus tigrinus ALCF2SS1-7]